MACSGKVVSMRSRLIDQQQAQPAHQPLVMVSPPTHEPVLQCKCGCQVFYITAIDFICTACATSHRD